MINENEETLQSFDGTDPADVLGFDPSAMMGGGESEESAEREEVDEKKENTPDDELGEKSEPVKAGEGSPEKSNEKPDDEYAHLADDETIVNYAKNFGDNPLRLAADSKNLQRLLNQKEAIAADNAKAVSLLQDQNAELEKKLQAALSANETKSDGDNKPAVNKDEYRETLRAIREGSDDDALDALVNLSSMIQSEAQKHYKAEFEAHKESFGAKTPQQTEAQARTEHNRDKILGLGRKFAIQDAVLRNNADDVKRLTGEDAELSLDEFNRFIPNVNSLIPTLNSISAGDGGYYTDEAIEFVLSKAEKDGKYFTPNDGDIARMTGSVKTLDASTGEKIDNKTASDDLITDGMTREEAMESFFRMAPSERQRYMRELGLDG